MTDFEKARKHFRASGLAFPTIPDELAPKLKERDRWVFSNRSIDISPYDLQHYVDEVQQTRVNDYAVVSHSGHGVNSYAIQYYLVRGSLCMFFHLGWGGAYANAGEDAATISDCFSLADRVVAAVEGSGKFQARERLTIVGSNFYGSEWMAPGENHRRKAEGHEGPSQVLIQALEWLTKEKRVAKCMTRSKKKR